MKLLFALLYLVHQVKLLCIIVVDDIFKRKKVFFSIYCDACNSIKSTTATKNNVQLLVDDKPTDCAKGLKTGEYDNVSLRFCAPELDDFLKSQGLDRKSWDEVIGPRVSLSCHPVCYFCVI